MDNLPVKSIMLDTSFLIRLMDEEDPLHSSALEYFRHFLDFKISIHVSTIAIAEYTVGDDYKNLPSEYFQVESFDFRDGITAGFLHKQLYGIKSSIPGYQRRIIANDIKILAQLQTKNIDGLISSDSESYKKYIDPLIAQGHLSMRFYDLRQTLSQTLGRLF